MTVYEYAYVDRRDIDQINELGAQGWRAVAAELNASVGSHLVLMERAKEPAIVVTMQDGRASTPEDHCVTYWTDDQRSGFTARCTCGWVNWSPHEIDIIGSSCGRLMGEGL